MCQIGPEPRAHYMEWVEEECEEIKATIGMNQGYL